MCCYYSCYNSPLPPPLAQKHMLIIKQQRR
uniref:Uncharacterized protein n=1 Tax=Anguilla anguilla TaxID=7936 RepID=A0A0E9VB87_ANGAN